ncbi:hypothetical protein [Segatella copri]
MALEASVLNVLDKSHEGNLNKLCFKSAAKIRNISLFMQVFVGFLLWFQRKNVNLQQNVERFNIKVMAATVLNSTQVHLLQMFQVDDSQKGLEELKELLYSYYSKKMDESLNELWDSGVLDQKRLDEINNMDLHKLEMS